MKLGGALLSAAFYGQLALSFDLHHLASNVNNYACPAVTPVSCSASGQVSDKCCYESPGGILLQTQFWDYAQSVGPADSFTNHGLWPDNCDGTYQQFCNTDNQIDDVSNLLNDPQFNGADAPIAGSDLLSSMETYWKSDNGDDESLWTHEYNKHGTCINTLAADCYEKWGVTSDPKKQAVYDYFRIAMDLFSKKNTYETLKAAGIVPSNDQTYSQSQIADALKQGHDGFEVHFICDDNGALNQVWYYHVLQGSLLGEQFTPIDSLEHDTECPQDGISYPPKGQASTTPPNKPNPPSNPNPPTSGNTGSIQVSDGSSFLIRNGHLYSGGSPATFTLIEAQFGGYNLKSGAGYCSVGSSDGLLSCDQDVSQASQFDFDSDSGSIGYSGSNDWHADSQPDGNEQLPVYAGSSDSGYTFQLNFVQG